jgi:hypothetical protein
MNFLYSATLKFSGFFYTLNDFYPYMIVQHRVSQLENIGLLGYEDLSDGDTFH